MECIVLFHQLNGQLLIDRGQYIRLHWSLETLLRDEWPLLLYVGVSIQLGQYGLVGVFDLDSQLASLICPELGDQRVYTGLGVWLSLIA